jgi:hypothetical protein
MRTEYSTTDPESFLAGFAGRAGEPGYDQTRDNDIAECNRDFVWSEEMQRGLIESILSGFPIPTFTLCNKKVIDAGQRSTTLWRFRNDALTIEFDGFSGKFSQMVAERPDLVRMWDRCKISLMTVSDATQDEMSKLYEILNKHVPLTHGQLLKNRSHFPLVAMALAMLGRGSTVFPLLSILQNVWKSKVKSSKPLNEVTFTFQVLVASLFGTSYYHTNFFNHLLLITSKTTHDIANNMGNLRTILNTISNVDPQNLVARDKKADCFKRFIGAMIYDFHSKNFTSQQYEAKWSRFFRAAYDVLTKDELKGLVEVGTKRAHYSSRMQGISENVDNYLKGVPIPQKDTDNTDESSEYEA